MSKIIGIDLGTTNSCAAIVEQQGQVKLIPYKGGEFIIPSIFAIDDKGTEPMGHEAKPRGRRNPPKPASPAKRLGGRSFSSDVVSEMQKSVAYEMRPGERNDVVLDVGKKHFRLAEISAKILNKIRSVAQDYLQEKVTRAVVTVPAYFTDRQRQAVKDAGKMIQLEVVRIIDEPTAAALAYGIGKSLHETVVIYDLGGGTFDVSIIEIRDRVFEVKATGGDIFLGGLDFDQAMIHKVIEDFEKKHRIDLSSDPVAMQRTKDRAERGKIDRSSRERAPFSVPFVTMTAQGQPLNIEFEFTRALLEEITQDLVDRTVDILTRVMRDADLDPKKVDELLLVGGQTRMPAVQKRLTAIFGKNPSKGVHPDEAVAIGAALYANSLEDNSNLRLQLLDVIPMAIGLEKAGGEFHTVFPRNAAIPNAKAVEATTSYNGQTEVAMRIFQGDNPQVAQNELLGDFLFSGLKSGPAGKARLEITFDVNIEGILTMSAKDLDTGKQMKTTGRVTQH